MNMKGTGMNVKVARNEYERDRNDYERGSE